MLHSQSPWDLSVYDKATPSSQPDISSAARAAAVLFEKQIRFEQVEHGGFFASDGSPLLTRVGLPAQVGFTNAEVLQISSALGLFTHNHPLGNSFSLADLLNACEWKLPEMRVVCEEWRHFLCFRNGWPSRPAVIAEHRRAEVLVRAEVLNHMRSGHVHPAYALWETQHRIVEHIANHFHIFYERERS